MLSFLGVTTIDALSQLPPVKAEYYEYVVREGDQLYYQNLPPTKRKLALKRKHEIEACTLISANLNKIDPDYLRVVMHIELGWPGAKIPTPANSSYDLGIAQINQKVWDTEFRREGINIPWQVVQNNTCANLYISGRILKGRLDNASDFLTGIANYHRYRTSHNTFFHDTYKAKATEKYQLILTEYSQWLSQQQTAAATTFKQQYITE